MDEREKVVANLQQSLAETRALATRLGEEHPAYAGCLRKAAFCESMLETAETCSHEEPS